MRPLPEWNGWGLHCVTPETPAPAWLAWVREPLGAGGRPRAVGEKPEAMLVLVHGRWSAVVGRP